MARPSKINDTELVERFLEAIRDGNYYEAACNYAGIDYKTFRNWMNRGEAAAELDKKPKSEKPFFQFFQEVKKAEAEAEALIVSMWRRQIPQDWKAAATFLERRYPDRWGRVDRLNAQIQQSGNVGLNITVNYGDEEGAEDE